MIDSVRELLFGTALKYCRMRLLPFDELGYEETCEYGLRRSGLHESLCRILDVDREVVEHAFTKATSRFGVRVDGGYVVDGSCKDIDFTGAYDAFCKELEGLDGLSDKERHPDVLSPDELDKMDFSGVSGLPKMGIDEEHGGNGK